MRFPIAVPLSCLLLLLTSACGSENGPSVSEAERQAGAESHPKLLAEFGGRYDGDEADYLAATGQKIAAAANLDGQCTFTLVNSDVVNAFAVPGCYIYVTRGLFSIVNSEGELASVLAHELGHIAANHSEQQQKRSIFRSLGVVALSVLTGSERISRVASAAAGYFTLRYSRKHEYEADDLGLSYLRGAGYSPFAAADMLSSLDRHTTFLTQSRGRDEARSIPEWALTHPLTANRIARAKGAAVDTGLGPRDLPEHEARYLRVVDGLLYGDDPEQGFVIGRRFAHPVMRITFEAPQGFSLTNSPAAVLIEGPDGMRGEFGGGRLPREGLGAYALATLGSLVGKADVQLGPEQRLDTNGLPTVVLATRIRTERGEVQLSLAAYDAGDGTAYHFAMVLAPSTPQPDAVAALFASLRLLTPTEVAELRPRSIRVAEVGPSDSFQSMGQRMASDLPVEHFMMINGRSPAERLRPGEKVKLVVRAN